jgi:signal transduction histidine kinase/CheY-like chemotaxis protein
MHRLVGPLISSALAVILLSLTGFAIWVAFTTHELASLTERSTRQTDSYQQAHYALSVEESLEREYQLKPSAEVRAQHAAAAAALVQALDRAGRDGDAADRAAVDHLLTVHNQYLDRTTLLFAAIDVGDMSGAWAMDAQSEEEFTTIDERVAIEAEADRQESLQHLAALGDTVRFVWTATPIVFAVGVLLLSVFWVVHRRERRARTQRELNHLKRAAQTDKLQALGQMATGIAHDLNQSLALVASYSDLARQALDQDPPELTDLRELLAIVAQAAMDGGETVKRLLTFASGPAHRQAQLIDLDAVLRDVAQLTAPRWRDAAQAEGRPISLAVDSVGATTIDGWAADLREAFTNLVFNAVDALPHGGTIRLSARRQSDQVVVEVADSGVGIPAEAQPRIFEPFFTTKGERHRGDIVVDSQVGHGTTFRITLPAAVPPAAAVVPTAPVARALPVCQALRVLAVDDEPAIGNAVARILRPGGHTVVIATSGEEALARLAAEPFDLVLSDIGMGAGMNGWELADRVHEQWPQLRFVLATGWGAAIDPAEAHARGVDAVLAKPYRAEDLKQLIGQPRSSAAAQEAA